MKRIAIASALALLVVASLAAQPIPPGRWWRMPRMVEALTLSDDQQNRLEVIFRGSANDLIDRKSEVEKQTIALRGELDQPELDRQSIQRTAARLNEARGRLFERELMMLVDMRAVLSDEQWTRMRSELDRARAERQPPGPRKRR
jgi:hypothetical protein